MNTTFTIIDPDGADDLSPSAGWGAIPPADRHAWARAMVDYCPWFPGPTMMNLVAQPILAGGTNAPEKWKRVARELHAVGFSPQDYYALCQELTIRHLQKTLTRDEHADLFEDWHEDKPMWCPIPVASRWQTWPSHLRAGRTPRRATDYVLSGGKPAPLGGLMDGNGGVTSEAAD